MTQLSIIKQQKGMGYGRWCLAWNCSRSYFIRQRSGWGTTLRSQRFPTPRDIKGQLTRRHSQQAVKRFFQLYICLILYNFILGIHQKKSIVDFLFFKTQFWIFIFYNFDLETDGIWFNGDDCVDDQRQNATDNHPQSSKNRRELSHLN